jgi:hypothetical protein
VGGDRVGYIEEILRKDRDRLMGENPTAPTKTKEIEREKRKSSNDLDSEIFPLSDTRK